MIEPSRITVIRLLVHNTEGSCMGAHATLREARWSIQVGGFVLRLCYQCAEDLRCGLIS